MINVINRWMKQIIFAVVITIIIEMLVPEGKNKKYIKTHIAVAFNFVDGYREGLVVNHKDGNKQNNNSENLEWITNEENVRHAAKNGLLKPSNCENHYHSKFSNEKVNEIRYFFAETLK